MELSKYISILKLEKFTIVYSHISSKVLKINNDLFKNIEGAKISNLPKEDIEKLQQASVLCKSYENQRTQIINENDTASKRSNLMPFVVFLNGSCNLNCVYCGQKHQSIKFDKELYESTISFFKERIKSLQNVKRVSVNWFGGEPLLSVKHIVSLAGKFKEICKRNNLQYASSITTNGVLLTPENYKQLCDASVSSIYVSLDGTSEFHNERRPLRNNKGSFDQIVSNLEGINKLDEHKCDIFLRINIDEHNYDNIEAILLLLKQRGLVSIISGLDIAPIHNWGNDAGSRAIEPMKFAKLKFNLLILSKKLGYIDKMPIPKRGTYVCNTLNPNSTYIDPEGNLFACSEFPLVPAHNDRILGNIKDEDRQFKVDKLTKWYSHDIKSTKCYNCKYLPLCGGGCPKGWEQGYKPCPDYIYTMEERILDVFTEYNK